MNSIHLRGMLWLVAAVVILTLITSSRSIRLAERDNPRNGSPAVPSAFYHATNPDEAIAALDDAIRVEPGRGELYNLRGETLEYLGRFDEAARDFAQAARLDSGSPAAWHNLIALQDWTGSEDRGAAAATYEQHVVRAEPANALYHRNLARLLDAAGQTERAESEFRAAVNLAAGDSSYCLELARYLQGHGPAGRTEALTLLQDALARNPADRGTLSAALGELAFTEQRYELAARAYEEAYRARPMIAEYKRMADESQRRARNR